jgi:hypothetical protein
VRFVAQWRCVVTLLTVAACGGEPPAPPMAAVGLSGPVAHAGPTFSFDSLDARPVSSDAFRGKTTVVSFVTTWDIASQAQVSYLVKMAGRDGARVNYAIVAVQEPGARELVEQYARVMHVTFPVAMGDAALLAGTGPLGEVKDVPTTLIVDASGRLVFRQSGVLRSDELRAHMPRD